PLDRLSKSPIDDEGLAVLAEHDVGRLEIAVEHAAAVCIGDDVADPHEVIEQLAELERAIVERPGGVELADSLLERLAADQPHCVDRSPVLGFSQRVEGHDAGVLEPAGDLGLEQEAGLALRVAGLRRLDQLEGDLAVEPAVAGHEYFAQAAASQRPEDLVVAG